MTFQIKLYDFPNILQIVTVPPPCTTDFVTANSIAGGKGTPSGATYTFTCEAGLYPSGPTGLVCADCCKEELEDCEANYFSMGKGLCVECPSNVALPVVLATLTVLVLVVIARIVTRLDAVIGIVSVTLSHFHYLFLILNMSFQWPPQVIIMKNLVRMMFLDLNILSSPECQWKLQYRHKWLLSMGLPLTRPRRLRPEGSCTGTVLNIRRRSTHSSGR